MPIVIQILLAALGGGTIAAVINGLFALLIFKTKRKAKREDEENAENKEMRRAVRLILLDRILYLGQCYIDKGEISYDDRRRLHEMHDCYHTGLGGNGDADLIMHAVDHLRLTTKKQKGENQK